MIEGEGWWGFDVGKNRPEVYVFNEKDLLVSTNP